MSPERSKSTVSFHTNPADFAPPPVFATPGDLVRLRELARWGAGETWGAALLMREVERIDDSEAMASARFVRLDSDVTYKDLGSKRIHRVKVTDSHAKTGRGLTVSALSPVGAALIGLEEGAIFRWMDPEGRFRAVKVLAIDE